jgi:hypothetical protein
MWVQVFGSPGSGKEEIVNMLTRRGFEHLKPKPLKNQIDSFVGQHRFLSQRIALDIQAAKVANRKNIVTVHGTHDTHLVYSKVLLKQERITQAEFDVLDFLYQEVSPILEPPNSVVFTKTSEMNASARASLRGATLPPDFRDYFAAYTGLAGSVKLPMVEVDFDLDMDIIKKDFEFNFASLRTTAVVAQTLWQRDFLRGDRNDGI